MTRLLLLLAALMLAAPAAAQNAHDDIEHIKEGMPVTLDPGSAYLLIRTEVPEDALRYNVVFVRALSGPELDDYAVSRAKALDEARSKPGATDDKVAAAMAKFVERYKAATNVIFMGSGRSFATNADGATYLLRVRPGRYMIAGPGYGAIINLCMCMGTVGFEAKPGVITDLGYVLAARADKPSSVAELRADTARLGEHGTMPLMFAMTVRPWRETMAVPPPLASMTRVPAYYYAIGKLPNLFGNLIGRMAPIPGVLAYDGDKVIDVKTGRRAPDIGMP